jgi:hypothetical protein
MWKGKPVFCERCHKDLYEEDLKGVWEKMQETCDYKGKQHEWKNCDADGSGFYDRRCGKGKQR